MELIQDKHQDMHHYTDYSSNSKSHTKRKSQMYQKKTGSLYQGNCNKTSINYLWDQ